MQYRDARDARDALRESDPYLQHEADDFADDVPPITFKEWLIAHARPRE